MQRIAFLLASLMALIAPPAMAQAIVSQTVVETVIWVDEDGNEVPAPDEAEMTSGEDGATWRFVESRPGTVAPAPVPQGIARFGPFRVIDGTRAAMVDVSTSATPAQFAAMLAAYPGIRVLEMVDVPGTEDDRANLKLGRMIRARGVATHVPDGGSVRSGGVELFLAGTSHTAAPGAEFAVHAWEDEDGLGPRDYAESAPENRAYVDFYQEMGMSPAEARAFYAMTNSAPFDNARWMNASQMGQWVRLR